LIPVQSVPACFLFLDPASPGHDFDERAIVAAP
jgi:hypothetical protein